MKPFLRWAGSKAQLLPELRTYWGSEYRRYIEPFCGSAALFFSLSPKVALLSDLNAELICTLRQVQHSADRVFEVLTRYPTDEANYYRIRALDPTDLSPAETAARFIFLNALCFNGLYRTNISGQFNVPYGSKTRIGSITASSLRKAGALLRNATIDSADFEEVVDSAGEGDFVYLDPPYVTSSGRIFAEYGRKVFSAEDIARLASSLVRADDRNVKFLLSYADVPEIRRLGKKWSMRTVEARRNIAGFTGSRRRVREVLITNVDGK